jgi:hypothetical protein
MTDLKNIKKKILKVTGHISDTEERISLITVETETPEESVSESSYALADCGHSYQPSTAYLCPFTSFIVCNECAAVCPKCRRKFYVTAGTKAWGTDDFYCPDHKAWAFFRTLFAGLKPKGGS